MTGKSAEPIHVARISLVMFDEIKERHEMRKRILELHFHNERGDEGVISYVSNPRSQWDHLEDTDAENVDLPKLDTGADHNSVTSSQYLSYKSRSVKSHVSGVAGTSSNDGELLSFNSPSSGTFNGWMEMHDNMSKFDLSSADSVSTS